MIRWLPLVLGLGCSAPTAAPTATDEPSVHYTLQTRQWQARPLIVFTPAADDPRWKEQLASLEAAADGMADREMDDVRITAGRGHANGSVMPASDVAALRERFGVQLTEFSVVLVGKDGGEKFRSRQPVPLQTVFETIDAMPMRRREMRPD